MTPYAKWWVLWLSEKWYQGERNGSSENCCLKKDMVPPSNSTSEEEMVTPRKGPSAISNFPFPRRKGSRRKTFFRNPPEKKSSLQEIFSQSEIQSLRGATPAPPFHPPPN